MAYTGHTGGYQSCLTVVAYDAPTAGLHTYKIQLFNFGGTAYSTRASLVVLVFQNA